MSASGSDHEETPPAEDAEEVESGESSESSLTLSSHEIDVQGIYSDEQRLMDEEPEDQALADLAEETNAMDVDLIERVASMHSAVLDQALLETQSALSLHQSRVDLSDVATKRLVKDSIARALAEEAALDESSSSGGEEEERARGHPEEEGSDSEQEAEDHHHHHHHKTADHRPFKLRRTTDAQGLYSDEAHALAERSVDDALEELAAETMAKKGKTKIKVESMHEVIIEKSLSEVGASISKTNARRKMNEETSRRFIEETIDHALYEMAGAESYECSYDEYDEDEEDDEEDDAEDGGTAAGGKKTRKGRGGKGGKGGKRAKKHRKEDAGSVDLEGSGSGSGEDRIAHRVGSAAEEFLSEDGAHAKFGSGEHEEPGGMTQSEERFYQLHHGMNRSLSGRTSLVTPRNSIMFDEEHFDPIRFDVQNSGEVRFDNSDMFDDGVSQTDFLEVESKMKFDGRYSPQETAGYDAPQRPEHYHSNHEYMSDNFGLFSEEDVAPDKLPTPEESQSVTSKSTTVREPCSRVTSRITTTCGDVSESTTSSEEEEDGCCPFDCDEDGPCKMRTLIEAGFPPFAPFGGWGGFNGYPMFHQAGVPITNMADADQDGDEMQLLKDMGVNQDRENDFKGKMMIYVDKKENSEDEATTCAGSRAGSRSGTAMSGASGVTSATSRTVRTTRSGLTSCADGFESEDEDILAGCREKKELFNAEMETAMPIRDALVEFFSELKFEGGEVDETIELYKVAYDAVQEANTAWRVELAKLDINVEDENTDLLPAEEIVKQYKPAPGAQAPQPAASAPGCDSLDKLEKVAEYVEQLIESLPLEEFGKLNEYMFKGAGVKPDIKENKENEPQRDDLDVQLEKLTKKKEKDLCYPFCEKTCQNPNENKKRKKTSRKQLADTLANSILKGAKKSVRRASLAHKSKPPKMSSTNAVQKCRMPKDDKLESRLVRRQKCFAPRCDGGKDFREVMGVHSMLALFPLLARIERGQPVKPNELHEAVKESEIPTFSFTLDHAKKCLAEWGKKGGRKIYVDEILYAIHNSAVYVKLLSEGSPEEIMKNIHKWETTNPKNICRPEVLRFPKPPSVEIPKPSRGPRSNPSEVRLLREKYIAAQAPMPSASPYRSVTKVLKSEFNNFAKSNTFLPAV